MGKIWQAIVNFFKNLFGKKPVVVAPVTPPYTGDKPCTAGATGAYGLR